MVQIRRKIHQLMDDKLSITRGPAWTSYMNKSHVVERIGMDLRGDINIITTTPLLKGVSMIRRGITMGMMYGTS